MRGLASERETLLEKVRARETDGDAMVTVTRAAREQSGMSDLSLQERMPEIYDALVDVFGRL